MLETWQLFALSLTGVLAGWFNVMAGGGSLLTVPAMIFMGVPAPVANGTNRIGILFQSISAVTAFFRKGYSDWKLSASLAGVASLGAIGGAQVGVHLEGPWFNRVLAAVMIAVMIIMSRKQPKPKAEETPQQGNLMLGHILMLGAGFWGGFIQIGVGFILMPILHKVMGFDLVRVNMHKVFIVLAYTVVALGVFASQVEILWIAGLALAIGTMIGGWIGAHMTISRGERWIRIAFNIALSGLIIKLLFFT